MAGAGAGSHLVGPVCHVVVKEPGVLIGWVTYLCHEGNGLLLDHECPSPCPSPFGALRLGKDHFSSRKEEGRISISDAGLCVGLLFRLLEDIPLQLSEKAYVLSPRGSLKVPFSVPILDRVS